MTVSQDQAVPRVLLGAGLRRLSDRRCISLWGELQSRQHWMDGGPVARHSTDRERLEGREHSEPIGCSWGSKDQGWGGDKRVRL